MDYVSTMPMDDHISKLLYELLKLRRALPEETQIFKDLKHDRDLCPKFQAQIENVLAAFEKYHQITYDIQGPRDQGTDILVRLPINDEDNFICLQIKSEDDLRNRDYLKLLKSQLFDTDPASPRILDYYIILCANTTDKSVKDKVRLTGATFGKTPKVTVIEPEYARTFLWLKTTQIDAITRNRLGANDVVFREGFESVKSLTREERALLYYLVLNRVYCEPRMVPIEEIRGSTFITEVYERQFEDEPCLTSRAQLAETRLLLDLAHLDDNYIESDDSGGFCVNLSRMEAVAALMLDGRIRYKYGDDNLLFYMLDLFDSGRE